MNITQEVVSENHLKIVLNFEPDDYEKKVDEELKTLSKKISIDGFRPGKVPYGLAKKMYGDTVLVEELNKIISDSLTNYIKDHDLKIFGEPLPLSVKENRINIRIPQSYTFGFEIGIMPEFQLPSFDEETFTRKMLKISDKMVDEEVDRLRSRFGERENPETISEEDILTGTFNELSDESTPKEGGINSTASFAVKNIKDEIARQQLMNLKKGEATDFNIRSAFGNDDELIIHHLLKTDHDRAANMNDRFRFSLTNIIRIKKAELNQEFFDKAFEAKSVLSEDQMKEKIKVQMQQEYRKYSDSNLDRGVLDFLLSKTKIELPADFLRRLINLNQQEEKGEMNDEEFAAASNQIKQDLIFRKLINDHQIVAGEEELRAEARKDVINYLGQDPVYFNNNPGALDNIIDSLLKDEKNASSIQQRVMNEKLFALLRSKVKFEEKEVDEHEFFHH